MHVIGFSATTSWNPETFRGTEVGPNPATCTHHTAIFFNRRGHKNMSGERMAACDALLLGPLFGGMGAKPEQTLSTGEASKGQ